MVSGVGSVGASDSGSGGGGGNDQPESSPKDPIKGKDPMVVEETVREVPVEPAKFVPPVGSSRHDPISKSDFAEYVDEDVLTQLLHENPAVVAAVLATREERLKQIALAEEEEELRR